jgi:hypothetical protein
LIVVRERLVLCSTTERWSRGVMDALKGECDGVVSDVESLVWESEMSDAVAHLASAYAAIQRLDQLSPFGPMAIVPYDLASQSVWTALVSLEEWSLEVWRSSGPIKRVDSVRHDLAKW